MNSVVGNNVSKAHGQIDAHEEERFSLCMCLCMSTVCRHSIHSSVCDMCAYFGVCFRVHGVPFRHGEGAVITYHVRWQTSRSADTDDGVTLAHGLATDPAADKPARTEDHHASLGCRSRHIGLCVRVRVCGVAAFTMMSQQSVHHVFT